MGAPAPLVSIPAALAPSGAHAEWFEGAGGARLRAALFPAQGRARGAVVVSPGRTEPIEKYFEVIGELTARGFQVLAHDWRGQGLSQRLLADPLSGHAEDVADFLQDFQALLDGFGARLAKPWLSLGHSMGACLVLLALTKGETRFAGAMLTAPMLQIVTRPWPRILAHVVAGLSVSLGQGSGGVGPAYDAFADNFDDALLTHDRARYDRYRAQLRACPDLALGRPTFGWVRFALEAGNALAARGALETVQIPVSLLLSGEDRLVVNAASRAAARRLPHAHCVEVPGARHEILMETDDKRAIFWEAFDRLAAEVTPPRA